jgi:hypothetical protein
MSTLDLGLLLNGAGRRTERGTHRRSDRGDADADQPALRMVLVEGETLRLPHSCLQVSVLSGTAWITQAGTDTLLHGGTSLELSAAGDQAVISAIGKGPLFFEMR